MFNYLRKGGVYVQPKKDRVTYAQLLHDILQEEQPDVWTQEKLDEVYNELADGKFFSVKLNNTIKRGLDFKISSTYTPQPGKQGETPPPVPSGAGHPSPAQTARPVGALAVQPAEGFPSLARQPQPTAQVSG